MSKPRFPATVESDVDDLERRLRILERSQGVSAVVSGGNVPVGTITAYWGASAPAGWLLCNGGSFSAGTYPDLATLLGGTTLPNLKGKVVVGIDGAQTEFDALGETGGAKTVALGTGNLPAHAHGLNGHDHDGGTLPDGAFNVSHDNNHGGETHNHTHNAINAFGITTGTHAHYIGGAPGEVASAPQGAGRASTTIAPATDGVSDDHAHPAHSNHSVGTHTHIVDPDSGDTTDGGFAGTAHANLQPYMALSYIIKAA